jgi:hypothetical protein
VTGRAHHRIGSRSGSRLRLIAGGFGGGPLRSLGSSTLSFFLSTTRLLLRLTLSHLLGTPGLFFRLTLGHFLSSLRSLLLSAHLLFFSRTAGLLLRTLHFSLLLTTSLLFSLALGHFLRPLCSFLLGTHLLLFGGTAGLLLRTLHFRLLLAAGLLFGLALGRHFLSTAFGFLLRLHLLLLSGTAGGFLLLTLLHGCGFSLLANPFCFCGSGLFGSHAFSRGTLLLRCHLLLLLSCCRSGLLPCFFSLGGGLVGGHALLLGGQCLLLRSGGLHAVLFRFGIRCGLFSGPFFCHATFLQPLLLALLHGSGSGLFPCCVHLSFFRFGGSGGHLIGSHLLCGHRLLRNNGVSRLLRHDGWWSNHHSGWGPFRLADRHHRGGQRFRGLVLNYGRHHGWR